MPYWKASVTSQRTEDSLEEPKPLRVVLQARTSSSRLPGKVLLPVAGIPLALLCARRLSREELDLVIATSTDASDDVLYQMVSFAGFQCVRGALEDVLGRFVLATTDMDDDQIVVRATADNPLPDVSFVLDLVAFMMEREVVYATTNSPIDGLPYGLSVEAMRVRVLRQAHCYATDPAEREHVTPWIRRHYPYAIIDRSRWHLSDRSAHRCTIDTFDDYQRVHKVFVNVEEDPIKVSWNKLVSTLAKLPESPALRVPYRCVDGHVDSLFALGTAQLGLAYGINNFTGQPSEERSVAIVRRAVEHGVTWVDTAQAYGDSERRVGRALRGSWGSRAKVITKLSPVIEFPADCSETLIASWVDSRLHSSLSSLEKTHLDVLLLHRWADYRALGGIVWRRLLHHRNAGLIGALGVSLYEPHEVMEALLDPDITHIQIPFNLMDRRWLLPELQQRLAARQDVRVHVRSVFLQGLLLSDGRHWPISDPEGPTRLERVDELSVELNRKSRADLCIAYVCGHPWVTSVALGVETLEQLDNNLRLVTLSAPLTADEIARVNSRLDGAPDCVVDPRQWLTS